MSPSSPGTTRLSTLLETGCCSIESMKDLHTSSIPDKHHTRLTVRGVQVTNATQGVPCIPSGGSRTLELKDFVEGLADDTEAVVNGYTESWSNGVVEGFINKVKWIT